MSTETQVYYKQNTAYSSLLKMSVASALLIAGMIVLVFFIHTDCNEMACLGAFIPVVTAQWLLVIPATLVIVLLQNFESRHNHKRSIKLIVLVGIPLSINILAACSVLYMPLLLPAMIVGFIWIFPK